jgi:hypothetical protein
LLLWSLVSVSGLASQPAYTQASAASLTGRWRVKFVFAGREEMNLVFAAQPEGSGSFLLLDSGPDNKVDGRPQPAAWLPTTNDRVSFSAEVELPLGTCCREVGTLIFKGKFNSNNALVGKVIFVASTEEEENPIGFRSQIGSFTATRILAEVPSPKTGKN